MPLSIPDDARLRVAIKALWAAQTKALARKKSSRKADTGNRGALTSGKHLAGLTELIREIVIANGLPGSDVLTAGDSVTIPGYFRASKSWDLLIVHNGMLIAAIELKSMGSSFGNNLNNRAEEILGQSLDFVKAHERRIFRDSPRPFLGYCVVLADGPKVTKPVGAASPHFAVLPEFVGASYEQRFNILCRRMVEEELYSEACLIVSDPKDGIKTGNFRHVDDATSFRRFAAGLAAHVAKITATQS